MLPLKKKDKAVTLVEEVEVHNFLDKQAVHLASEPQRAVSTNVDNLGNDEENKGAENVNGRFGTALSRTVAKDIHNYDYKPLD